MEQLQGRYRIILGSASPRRKELLSGLGLTFTIDSETHCEEKYDPTLPHEQIPLEIARAKSSGFHRALEDDEILITADTMVFCGTEIMGKPTDREDAVRMLEMLSGKNHTVTTGVHIRSNFKSKDIICTSIVSFKQLSAEEINYYIDKFKPFDKAGAYGIQEWIGYIGITGIEGSYYNIMGLPVQRVYTELLDFR